ncbi:MAG: cupin-like domain-containing protein [Sulfurimonas sp.]|nr:cupin-like domain-containing protein [Sulfurimonas sp.]
MIEYERVDIEQSIKKEDFLKKYKEKEIPVLIKNLTKDWKAHSKWSLDYFQSLAGEREIKLYDSNPAKNKKLQHAAELVIPMQEYFQLLRNGEKNLRMFFYNILEEIPELRNDFSFPDIGLKFFKKLPVLFLAGKGAKVQMHFDIDYADILLCHFGAKKNVILFSPEQSAFLYHVPFSFSALNCIDFETPDLEMYPALHKLKGKKITLVHGDALYIPPGWWHYISYDDISYSLALRAFPRKLKYVVKVLRNLFWTRTVEGIMRKLFAQKWNDRNERLAMLRTNKGLGV